ncbi:hypothetical protein [Ralstonia solanacearum]|uniref:hypothetical protein n=1 Tax=Ralstonia solanacearum TaxID=305 RepID=UPI0018D1C9B2|nr:hypothetical protein [Ralstonia solanacearum]
MTISLKRARQSLGALWFIGGGLVYLLLIALSLVGRFEDQADKVWAWFLPTTMPTLTLIAGVLVTGAAQWNQQALSQAVEPFLFWSSIVASGLYLLCVALVVLMPILTGWVILESMHQSNLFLGPFQSIVTALLGVFFVRSGRRG